MKTIITNYRYWVLAVLLCPAIILLIGLPKDGADFFHFLVFIIITKYAAFVLGFYAVLLYRRWSTNGKIPELTRLIDQC